MQKVFIILTSFIANACIGQSISEIAITILSKENLVSKTLSNSIFIKNKILVEPYSVDSLDFGVTIYFDIFNDNGQVGMVRALGTSKEPAPDYQIVAYTTNDTIFLKRVNRINYEQDSVDVKSKATSVLFSVDTVRALSFIEKHNEKYQSAFTLDDFLNRSGEFGSFGFLCGGYVPYVTDDAYKLAKLVKENDTATLKILASSFSAQDRAYGCAGLFFLQLRGKKLSQRLVDLIKLNQQSQIKIHTCGGCIINKEPLSVALEKLKLQGLYQLLINYQLL
jgi:hypothetical protein